MNRYQQGSLFKLKRKSCADVWVFRWYECKASRRVYKKQIIGDVKQIHSRCEAEKAVQALRTSINVDIGTLQTIRDLQAHYKKHELTEDRKSFSTIDNHRLLYKRYVDEKMGALSTG